MDLKKLLKGESPKDSLKALPKKLKEGAPMHFAYIEAKASDLPVLIYSKMNLNVKDATMGVIERKGDVIILDPTKGRLTQSDLKSLNAGLKKASVNSVTFSLPDPIYNTTDAVSDSNYQTTDIPADDNYQTTDIPADNNYQTTEIPADNNYQTTDIPADENPYGTAIPAENDDDAAARNEATAKAKQIAIAWQGLVAYELSELKLNKAETAFVTRMEQSLSSDPPNIDQATKILRYFNARVKDDKPRQLKQAFDKTIRPQLPVMLPKIAQFRGFEDGSSRYKDLMELEQKFDESLAASPPDLKSAKSISAFLSSNFQTVKKTDD
ncbi:MAG: hypothetical protein ABJ360_13220 [Roseobacter sp.]|uniref:hypothetical protein n=1 Tax=Tateyamaria sp. TaxID=1929288 RepID=UPI003271F18A